MEMGSFGFCFLFQSNVFSLAQSYFTILGTFFVINENKRLPFVFVIPVNMESPQQKHSGKTLFY